MKMLPPEIHISHKVSVQIPEGEKYTDALIRELTMNTLFLKKYLVVMELVCVKTFCCITYTVSDANILEFIVELKMRMAEIVI